MVTRMTSEPHPIGLFGLGNMGLAVAERLALGAAVSAYDPDPARGAEAQRNGVQLLADPQDLRASTVILSLPSPRVSRQVVEQLAVALEPGSVIIETSTVTPSDARSCAEVAEAAGLGFIDAAILSGVAQMRAGASTLLVGGDASMLEKARPVLEVLAAEVRHLGPVGSGMAAKVINNAVAHAVMVVLVEAGAMAASAGLPPKALVELLSSPEAGLTRPLTHRYAERILSGHYEGGMPMDAARKDSTLALAMAQESQVPLFSIQAAHTVYELALAQGLQRLDYAAIATLWEQWTGRQLSASDDKE